MSRRPDHLVEHFFRHGAADLVAVLTRTFGIRHLELVEDAVQGAMVRALHAWRLKGVPPNPSGWLHVTARNQVLDALRRQGAYTKALGLAGLRPERIEADLSERIDAWLDPAHLPDSQLRMLFVCCHPELDRRSQIALALKVLLGFSIREIARGLMLGHEATKKRLQRAKRRLAVLAPPLELPPVPERAARLDGVHDVLYAVFSEGYSSSATHDPVRDDLCEEAARLTHILAQSAVATPDTHALLALMLFHGARLEARVDDAGAPVLLADQDRSRWDPNLIGFAHRALAIGATQTPGRFHFEAAIAMHHACAKRFEATNWEAIRGLYDQLVTRYRSPLYVLNRAIARAELGDLDGASADLRAIEDAGALTSYVHLPCAWARVHEKAGDAAGARRAYEQALARPCAPHEARFLQSRLEALA